jgi:hypothetical protein
MVCASWCRACILVMTDFPILFANLLKSSAAFYSGKVSAILNMIEAQTQLYLHL